MLKNFTKTVLLVFSLYCILRVTSVETAADCPRHVKAMEMLKYINLTADPCEDFYEFSCGNWNKYHSIAGTNEATSSFLQTLQSGLNDKLQILLISDYPEDTAVDKKVKNYYRACLNLAFMRAAYPAKLREIIAEFGQMPALVGYNWEGHEFDWLQTITKITYKYGIGIITGAVVTKDFADNSRKRLYLFEAALMLDSSAAYLDRDNAIILQRLLNYIASKLHNYLGLHEFAALQTAKDVVDFEISLAKCKDGSPFTLSFLEEIHAKYFPIVDVNNLVLLSLGSIPQLQVYYNRNYLDKLVETLKVTPTRVLANYIFYNLIDKFIVSLPQAASDHLPDICLNEMKSHFSKNFDNLIYRQYNSWESEHGVQLMWQNIKWTFKKALESEEYHWIGVNTRKYAIEKLHAMKLEIVSYQNYNFSADFEELSVNHLDYVENLKSFRSLGALQNRKAIEKPPRPLYLSSIVSTTPVNVLLENTVKVPVVLLQPHQVWSTFFPNAFNYGVLAALLAHELVHGFDNNGRSKDLSGNQWEWWDSESTHNFNLRSQCFNEQYQRFTFQGRHLPPMPSQGENIADNGGLRLAYAAYLNWYHWALQTNAKSVLESMPGLSFNNKKLFFISYGQLWCGDVNPLYRRLQESTDSHVPHKFRVIGPLSNFEQFSREFNCPLGSSMNPVRKCKMY